MPKKGLDLGLLPMECPNRTPCRHCMSYNSLKGKGSLPFYLAEKVAREIGEYKFKLNGISLSGGEPLAYRSQGHDVIDLIGMFPEDTPIIIATQGASCAKYEKIMRRMEPLKCSVFWRFSYHRFTERDLIKTLEKTLSVLDDMRWPVAVGSEKKGFMSKEIQVSAENDENVINAARRLEKELFDGDYKLRGDKNGLVLEKYGDIIPIKLSTITWRGLARKNFRPNELQRHAKLIDTCPLESKSFLGIDNAGQYRVCDPSENPDFPSLGDARQITIPEAFEKKREITKALKRMFPLKADLRPFANQPCAYCEDNLHKFLSQS